MGEALGRIDWSVQRDQDLEGASVDVVRKYVSHHECMKHFRSLTTALANFERGSPQMLVLTGNDTEDRDTMHVSW